MSHLFDYLQTLQTHLRKPLVLILRAAPGFGKSTLIQKFTETQPDSGVCSADYFFMRNGVYEFDFNKLTDAHAQCFNNFILLLGFTVTVPRKFIFVDNTNLSAVECAPYVLGAQALGAFPVIVNLHRPEDLSPMETALRNTKGLGEERLEGFLFKGVAEVLPPWWNVINVQGGTFEVTQELA